MSQTLSCFSYHLQRQSIFWKGKINISPHWIHLYLLRDSSEAVTYCHLILLFSCAKKKGKKKQHATLQKKELGHHYHLKST